VAKTRRTEGPPGHIRIIGGRWRGRRLPVPDAPGLRPTPDRARETLFNWLQPVIPGACCLDLFAGTGALGFEALSRGAAHVHFVDNNAVLADAIQALAQTLAADATVLTSTAGDWLQMNTDRFDVIFLDPPFGQDLIAGIISLIGERHCLKPGGLVYIESERGIVLPPGLEIKKQKTAGDVQFGLYELI
jgi:16S rRNA (guanine966-N2)-methyltransferase